MDQKYLIPGIAISLGLILLIGFVFLFRGSLWEAITQSPREEQVSAPQGPVVSIDHQGTHIVVSWERLPSGTKTLSLFRRRAEEDIWNFWKTISILPGSDAMGSTTIYLSLEEAGENYFYRVEALLDNGKIAWESGSTPLITPFSQGEARSTQPQTPQIIASSTTTSQLSSSITTQTPSSSSSVSNVQTPTTTQNNTHTTTSTKTETETSSILYYNPQLILSGSSDHPSGYFWVRHAGEAIEIGWQNLPNDTSYAIIARSLTESGPYETLMSPSSPAHPKPYSIRIRDHTLNEPYYYRMETYKDNIQTATYGPYLLPPL